jgi:hypothetical protein
LSKRLYWKRKCLVTFRAIESEFGTRWKKIGPPPPQQQRRKKPSSETSTWRSPVHKYVQTVISIQYKSVPPTAARRQRVSDTACNCSSLTKNFLTEIFSTAVGSWHTAWRTKTSPCLKENMPNETQDTGSSFCCVTFSFIT